MPSYCCSCKKESQTMVEQICDHDLCFDCAQKIKIPQGVPPLDAKFRITCPACKRNTTTLNIQNLIKKDNEKMLFINMESSQLSEDELQQPHNHEGWNKLSESKLKKMSYTERRSNVYAERKTPDITQRASKASQDSKRNTGTKSRPGETAFEVKCNAHKQPLMFYCQMENIVMCMQCMYRHMKEQKTHQVCSVTDAINVIANNNKSFKLQAKKKMEEIQKFILVCKGNKNRIDQAFQIHSQLINQEFRQLQNLIKKKEMQAKQYLQTIFKKKQKEVDEQMNDLNYLRGCLKEHYEYSIQNPSSQLYFFNAFSLLRGTINKVVTNYKQIKRDDLGCFEKLTSIEDFSILLEKFFRPKIEGRESKAVKRQTNAPSRGNSQSGQNGSKIKQQIIEQTKKRLQKLNRMQNEQKDFKINKEVSNKKQDYLNNYFIQQLQKKDLQSSGFASYDKNGPNNPLNYRKSSASQYTGDKKIVHKTLTPTRLSSGNPKTKKKQTK